MKYPYPVYAFSLLLISLASKAQGPDNSTTVSFFTGAMNYQGDMNPNSFTFQHSGFTGGIIVRKPLGRWFALRAGATKGKIEAADRWNRDYLKPRNLDFTTAITEAHAALEISVLDLETNRFTPYLYGGLAVFHFNPWTTDNNGVKTFLKPLSTEGQGLSQYPNQQPYNLVQIAFAFGGGLKFAVSDRINIGLEMSQRKTFTDYLDDLSSNYVDRDVLLQARGPQAVALAYRGDEIPGGNPLYPAHGEQRGTPSEMDWYYYTGLTVEIKLSKARDMFRGGRSLAGTRCPRFASY